MIDIFLPKLQVAQRIRAQVTVKVVVFYSLTISLSLCAFQLQKHAVLEAPFVNEDLCLHAFEIVEEEELVNFELVVFVFKRV
jgi:hypothetical protein